MRAGYNLQFPEAAASMQGEVKIIPFWAADTSQKISRKKTLVKALPRIDVIGNTNVLKDYEFTVFWS